MNDRFKPGQKVHYVGGAGETENGIVKGPNPHNPDCVYVVYSCADDWLNYRNFTGQSTQIEDLREGWV